MQQNPNTHEPNPSHFEESQGTPEQESASHQNLTWDEYRDTIQGMRFFDPHIHMTSRTTANGVSLF